MPIHPTAIIGKNVSLDDTNDIGPHVVIEDGVRMGARNKILAGAYLCSGTEIGNDNEIHMHTVVGHTPQDLAYQGAKTKTMIGDKNVIREFVTIHRGTKEGTATTIGNNNFLMAYVHLAHNCQIGNRVVLVNGASLAGYCMVEDDVFISGMTVFHQFTRTGRLAMISGLSAVNKDVPPFMICGGRGSVVHAVNIVGLRRAGVSELTRNEIRRAYKLLYRSDLNIANALSEIEKTCSSDEVHYLVDFVRASKRGICQGGKRSAVQEVVGQEEGSLDFSDD